MSLGNVFDIAGSGMTAQSLRLNTTASNIANAETASSSTETAYRARKPVFSAIQQSLMNPGNGFPVMGSSSDSQAGAGVRVEGVVESDAELQMRYEPDHPAANEDGYVFYPNVNVVEEMADMMSSSRSFQMNVDVMNTAKSMMQRILTLGQQ